MSISAMRIAVPLQGKLAGFYRFSVKQYESLLKASILTEEDDLELLEGYILHKHPENQGSEIEHDLYRFSIEQYEHMISAEILTENDHIELIHGFLVRKMPRNPRHDGTLVSLHEWLIRIMPRAWQVRAQCAIRLDGSMPEPDLAIVKKVADNYRTHHPEPKDIEVVIEISDSTLRPDRADKKQLYAEAMIPTYWIINLVDQQIEVYTNPQNTEALSTYQDSKIYRSGDEVPIILQQQAIGMVPVIEILG
jgi:Uma2 family endonuclease